MVRVCQLMQTAFSRAQLMWRRHPAGLERNNLPRWPFSTVVDLARDQLGLFKALRKLKRHAAGVTSTEELFAVIANDRVFSTDQKAEEMVPLLKLLARKQPKYICEIGSASGGTLFLLAQICRPDAVCFSIDLTLSFQRAIVYGRFGGPSQKITIIRGDSASSTTQRQLRRLLNYCALDLLFIDGDHAYEGVKADFAAYAPLVKEGGLIALHDIVQDHKAKYGIDTDKFSGGVPTFWQELKNRYRTEELIANQDQDGYGIGLVYIETRLAGFKFGTDATP
jgi:predicted O-methyltransferase YrrM